MAVGANEKDDLPVSTFENNETYADEEDLLSNAANNEAQDKNNAEKIQEIINKNIVENNPQQDYNNKSTKPGTEQSNSLDKADGFVKNNLNSNQTCEATPNKDTNDDKKSKLELTNELVKNINKEAYGENKDAEKKEEKIISRRSSHYLQNIQMTNSSLGLTLGSEKKDTTLLTDSNTVARFSPLWKQVLYSYIIIFLDMLI